MATTKKACALLINDVHVSKDNISEFHDNWNEALDVCAKMDIPEIIVGGDLWQSRSSQTLSTLLAVRQAIIKAGNQGISLTLAEGNHDKVDQESLLGYSHIFSEYKNVEVVDDYVAIEYGDDVLFYVMSYFPETGSFIQRLQELKDSYFNKTKKNILYIHEGINGGLAMPNDKELPANIFAEFDAVLVGHYHDRKRIPNTNIEYIGSSRQHNFGEDEYKGYTIIYSDGSYEFVQNQANMRYKVIEISPNEIDNDLIEELTATKEEGKYKIKAKIQCSTEESASIDKQKLIEAGVSKVEIITEAIIAQEVVAHSIEQKFDKAGIKSEYTNFCENKATSSEMGLYYLDKIN